MGSVSGWQRLALYQRAYPTDEKESMPISFWVLSRGYAVFQFIFLHSLTVLPELYLYIFSIMYIEKHIRYIPIGG